MSQRSQPDLTKVNVHGEVFIDCDVDLVTFVRNNIERYHTVDLGQDDPMGANADYGPYQEWERIFPLLHWYLDDVDPMLQGEGVTRKFDHGMTEWANNLRWNPDDYAALLEAVPEASVENGEKVRAEHEAKWSRIRQRSARACDGGDDD